MQWLQNADSKVTMKDVMLRVTQYKTTLKELTLLRIQAEAAKTMAQQSTGFDRSALFAKAPGEKSSSSSSSLAPKKHMLEAAKACVLSGQYTPLTMTWHHASCGSTAATSTTSARAHSTHATSRQLARGSQRQQLCMLQIAWPTWHTSTMLLVLLPRRQTQARVWVHAHSSGTTRTTPKAGAKATGPVTSTGVTPTTPCAASCATGATTCVRGALTSTHTRLHPTGSPVTR